MEFFSVLRRLGGLQLKLQAVSDKRDKLRIGGFSFGVGHGVSKETLQSIQVTPIPCYFDCMANGPLYPAGRGLEGLCHLGVEYLGDGVRGLSAHAGASRSGENAKGL